MITILKFYHLYTVEINGEFNESYRIVIPYRKLQIHIVK